MGVGIWKRLDLIFLLNMIMHQRHGHVVQNSLPWYPLFSRLRVCGFLGASSRIYRYACQLRYLRIWSYPKYDVHMGSVLQLHGQSNDTILCEQKQPSPKNFQGETGRYMIRVRNDFLVHQNTPLYFAYHLFWGWSCGSCFLLSYMATVGTLCVSWSRHGRIFIYQWWVVK